MFAKANSFGLRVLRQVEDANLTRFAKWLRRERGLEFDSYDAMWHWSVTELEDFRRLFGSQAAVQYWFCSRLCS